MVLEHRRCRSTARRRASRASVGQHPHSGNARRPPILFLCCAPAPPLIGDMQDTQHVYCSPLSIAEPRNLSHFDEGAYYTRILICEPPILLNSGTRFVKSEIETN